MTLYGPKGEVIKTLPRTPPPAKPCLIYGHYCDGCGRFYIEEWWHRLFLGHEPTHGERCC